MSLGIQSYHFVSQFNTLKNDIADSAMRLSTGKKINSSKDDAAGLAISTRYESITKALGVGIRNASDSVSVLDTADQAVSGIQSGLHRLRELSVQSANGVLSDDDRALIDAEAQQIKAEIGRVVDATSFNGRNILSENQSFNVQLSGNSQDQVAFSTQSLSTQFNIQGLDEIDLSSASSANAAISSIDAIIDVTTQTRSEYGAISNRLTSAINNLSDQQVATTASKSRITDTDFAEESVKLNRSLLLEQATIAVQVQANASSKNVLALLER